MSGHIWSEKSKRKLSLSMRKAYAKKRRKAALAAKMERLAPIPFKYGNGGDTSIKAKGNALRAIGAKDIEAVTPTFYRDGQVANTFDAPDTIYVLVNGKLLQFKLRTMPVYLPSEELK